MIDLSGLSDKDLLELQNKIKEERERRDDERLYKRDVSSIIADKLFYRFDERDKVPVKCLTNETPFNRVCKSIFTICDYSLGNFKYRVSALDKHYWTANTDYIKVDTNAYKNMVNDLIELINNYFDGQSNAESLVQKE